MLRDSTGNSCYIGGAHLKDRSVLWFLPERGSDVMYGRKYVQPRYKWPRLGRVLEIVCLLLEQGGDLEAMSGDGKTALQVVGEGPPRGVD